MSYVEMTETFEDGSSYTYREYQRSKWIAFFLAFFLGGLGIHFFYARHHIEGWLMIGITIACLTLLPMSSAWTFTPIVLSGFMAVFFLLIPKEEFDNYVNARNITVRVIDPPVKKGEAS